MSKQQPTANLSCLQSTRRFQTQPDRLNRDPSMLEQFRAQLATSHHTQAVNWRTLKNQLKQMSLVG